MTAGKVTEACSAFEASNRIEPRAGTLLHLGECREKNQQLASAWSAYKDAQNLAVDPRMRQYATTKVAVLEPRLSYLTVAVSGQSRIPGLALTRNGASFDLMLWNRALPVDGGDYIIVGRAQGYETWQKAIHVPLEGAKLSVDVPALTKASRTTVPEAPLPQTPSKPPTAPPAQPTQPAPTGSVTTVVDQTVNIAAPPPPSVVVIDRPSAPPSTTSKAVPSNTSSNVIPLVVGVGSLALLGGGLGFELWAESKYASAKSEMTSQVRRDSLYNSANMKRYTAEAIAAGGFAAGAAAVWLYLRDDNHEHTGNASVHVVPTGTGVAFSGQF